MIQCAQTVRGYDDDLATKSRYQVEGGVAVGMFLES